MDFIKRFLDFVYRLHSKWQELNKRIICKIEKIESKNRDRNKKNIAKNMITKLNHMLSAEPSTKKHSNTKCNRRRKIILPSYKYGYKTPDKPKYRHCGCKSLRHKSRKFDNKCIIEIVPYSWSSDKHIPEDIETKKTYIIKTFSSFWYMCICMNPWLFHKGNYSQENHTDSWDSIYEPIRYREDEICAKKTSNNRYNSTNPEKSSWNISAFIKKNKSSKYISDFPELVCDTCHLWTHTEKCQKSNSENRNSSWRKTPKVCREESDTKDDKNFKFFGHN